MRYVLFWMAAWIPMAEAAQYPVMLGGTTVIIKKERYGRGKNFVHLHQNETTALKAAKAVVKEHGGSLLTLVHPGGRNIVFHLHQRRYEFDPNRIFTDVGIRKTLAQFGGYTREASAEVKKLSNKIKRLLPRGKIIAVHNNESYSIRDYFPGRQMSADARHLYFDEENHFRNFYLVTKSQDYHRLIKLKFNGVLQAHNAIDDGSLSIYLSKRHYINVEAGYDQLAAQIQMLKHA